MKRYAFVAVLALATAACFDTQPTGVAPEDLALGEFDGGRPAPRLELKPSKSAFSTAVCCGCGCPLDVYGKLPYTGTVTGTYQLFVVGTGFFPEPNAFISIEDLTLHQFLFEGYGSVYNGTVVAGAEVTVFNTPPGGFPAGQGMPVVHDLVNGRMVDLPLPATGVGGIPTGMLRGRRPSVAGTVTLDGGQTVAVLWTWNSGTREYDVELLPSSNPAGNSAVTAMNERAGLIIGSMDGHPAIWPIGAPLSYTEHASIDGEFRGLSPNGILVGSEDGVGGFRMLAADPPASRVAVGVEPYGVNSDALVVGTAPDGSGAIVLANGILKPLPFPSPGADQGLPRFISNFGTVGGQAGTLGSMKPVTWAYTPFDTDKDAAPDGLDNCPMLANPMQEDADTDDVGDMCDTGNPPSLSITASTLTRVEGGFIGFKSTASDPLGRTLSYDWNFGDGGFAFTPNVQYTFVNDGVFNVVASVSNGFDTVTDDVTVTIINARPEVIVTAAPTATVGVPFDLQFDATDRGVADLLRYKVLWGDTQVTNGTCGTSPCTVNLQHTYSATGPVTLRVQVYDADGGSILIRTDVTVN